MVSGIRATVEFTTTGACPLVELSTEKDTTVESVDANFCPTPTTASVTEFSADVDLSRAEEFETVFSHGSTHRFRYTHDEGVNCPCECLGSFGCPVVRYVATDGTLTLVFHAADYAELQAVVADLRDRFSGVNVKRLVRSPETDRVDDSVFVDRGKLTARQMEVLKTAYGMGYFERPRRANATDVAEELDISLSTFSEHLAAAERKILQDFF